MLHIAICDDHKDTLLQIEQSVQECLHRLDIHQYRIVPFSSPDLLLARSENELFDLHILDIVMPERSGISLARELYLQGQAKAILFLTSSPEYALESYEVEALDYLLKPIKPDRLLKAFTKYLQRYPSGQAEEIVVQHKSATTRIALNTLCYLESLNHQVLYHTADGQATVCRQTLQEAEAPLQNRVNFFKANRSQIVNFDHVSKINASCITMKNGEKIYASRPTTKALTEAYLKYKIGRI